MYKLELGGGNALSPYDGVNVCYDLYLSRVTLIHLITVGDSELKHRLLALP